MQVKVRSYFRNLQHRIFIGIVSFHNIRCNQLVQLDKQWKLDITSSTTMRPLRSFIRVFAQNDIDCSFHYFSDSLSIISCIYSCKTVVYSEWRLTCLISFRFNYLVKRKRQRLPKSSVFGVSCGKAKCPMTDQKTNCESLISIFQSRVSSDIF